MERGMRKMENKQKNHFLNGLHNTIYNPFFEIPLYNKGIFLLYFYSICAKMTISALFWE